MGRDEASFGHGHARVDVIPHGVVLAGGADDGPWSSRQTDVLPGGCISLVVGAGSAISARRKCAVHATVRALPALSACMPGLGVGPQVGIRRLSSSAKMPTAASQEKPWTPDRAACVCGQTA